MFKFRIICIIVCCFFIQVTYSQEEKTTAKDTVVDVGDGKIIVSNKFIIVDDESINPLAPATAAFYSAVLPGLGQAYNKKYWKIPIVYAVLGTSTYAYIYNNKLYNKYRDAFKLEESGKPHEFDSEGDNYISREGLMRAQTRYKEDRDLSLIITIGLYVLQIVEASVNAHLLQMNTLDNISFNPNLIIDPLTNKVVGGLTISYKF